MALNRCEFIGNLGRDPEARTTQGGTKVVNLRIAVTEKWKDKSTGERKENTEWVPCVIWGALAKVAEQYLRKGSKVFVAGKFETRKWTDQQGQDRYTTEINVTDLEMLDGPQGNQQRDDRGGYDDYSSGYGGGQSSGGYGGGGRPGGGASDMDDEIPFIMEWR